MAMSRHPTSLVTAVVTTGTPLPLVGRANTSLLTPNHRSNVRSKPL